MYFSEFSGVYYFPRFSNVFFEFIVFFSGFVYQNEVKTFYLGLTGNFSDFLSIFLDFRSFLDFAYSSQ